MELIRDLKTAARIALPRTHGETAGERLESFYRDQAADYDRFRKKMLPGREDLIRRLPWAELAAGVWLDVGCGTGMNLEIARDHIPSDLSVVLLDLTPSLLAVAQTRVSRLGLESRVQVREGDATELESLKLTPSLVTCSYSLTMIPQWWRVIDAARRILRPGGYFAAVDFHVSRKFPATELTRHSWWTRQFWRSFFDIDSVFPSPDHLPYLQDSFETISIQEGRHRLPFVPFVRTPYYQFLGRKGQ